MRIFLAAFATLFALAATAEARCGGENLVEKLRTQDPQAAERVEAMAAEIPNGEGKFWRVTKDGIAPSYLYGTFHVGKAVDFVPDAAWTAMDKARVAVFEVSLDEKEAFARKMATDPTLSLDRDAPPFTDRMSPEDAESLEQAFTARGVAGQVAQRLQPWLQISMLALPACILPTLQTAPAVDEVLADRAAAAGVPVVGLEDPEESIASLTRLSDDVINKLLISTARLFPIEEDVFETNLQLYRDGRIAMIQAFSSWLVEDTAGDLDIKRANERMFASLLHRRNREWMPRVLNEVGKGNAFIAVGALHLTGETGLVEALKREGYTLTRLD